MAAEHRRSFVVDARMPAYTGAGISRYVQGLLGGLADLRPDQVTALLSRRDCGAWWRPLARRGVSICYARTPCHHRLERWTLPLEVLPLRPALLHTVDHVGPGIHPFPTVVTVHDLAFWRYPWTHEPASRRYYAGTALTLPNADAVICVSAFIRDELLAILPLDAGRVHVVHNGLDSRFQHRPDRALVERKYGLHGPYVLTLGTVEERKNLLVLLEAFRQLGQDDIHLAVAGADGWGAEHVWQTVCTLGLERRVHRLGRVDDADLVALYSTAELLAFPSLYEGFAFPPLEAMACGTPVVALRTGPLPEVCGNGVQAAAELVDGTAGALAGGMQRLLTNTGRRAELIARGLNRASMFSWRRCAEATLDVYARAQDRRAEHCRTDSVVRRCMPRGVVHSPIDDA